MDYSYLFYEEFPEGVKSICIGGQVMTKEEFLFKKKQFLKKKKKNFSTETTSSDQILLTLVYLKELMMSMNYSILIITANSNLEIFIYLNDSIKNRL